MIFEAGTVGCSPKYEEPSRPDSSAVTNTKSCERRGFMPSAAARAIASIDATPEALSTAPF
jgi:hypothetical protein